VNPRLTWEKYLGYWTIGIAATALVFWLCLAVGTDGHHVTFGWQDSDPRIGWGMLHWRVARVGTAALVGAALAASGVVLQGLLRNPLAEPYVLGISSGSGVGIMLWLVLGTQIATATGGITGILPEWMQYSQAAPALAGALVACVVVFGVSRAVSRGGMEPLTLLLVGVVFSAFCGALVMLLNAVAPHGIRADIMNFLVGHVSDGTSPKEIAVAGAVFGAGWLAAIGSAGAMNIAALSDTEAASLGVRLGRLRTVCFISASIMTAASIALARSIGFVGLICPHICRLLFGPDHRQLIVTAPFCGAIFLMLADALVQVLRPVFPAGVQVGVVTALVGAPFFMLLLARRGAVANG